MRILFQNYVVSTSIDVEANYFQSATKKMEIVVIQRD
jgi:hypothetical protein